LLDSEKNIFALVNSASIFEPIKFMDTTLEDWHAHLDVNLTIPFLLSQAFARSLGSSPGGSSTSWIGAPCGPQGSFPLYDL
jgi:NAD(P)-dependent dehydrogenase (short-subunit alcohol dehydrogenase family)